MDIIHTHLAQEFHPFHQPKSQSLRKLALCGANVGKFVAHTLIGQEGPHGHLLGLLLGRYS